MSVSLSRRRLIHVPKIIAEWKLLHISALPVPKNMLHHRTADKSMSQTGTVWSGKKVMLQVAHKSCEERSTNHPVPQRFHLCQRVYLHSKVHTFKSSLHQSCCFFCSMVSSQHIPPSESLGSWKEVCWQITPKSDLQPRMLNFTIKNDLQIHTGQGLAWAPPSFMYKGDKK